MSALQVQEMTKRQLIAAARKIIKKFHSEAIGDPYGWDWPTMSVLFPDEVAEYRSYREEYLRRRALGLKAYQKEV